MSKRRTNGEGNLRKRKDGRWEGRYTAGTDPVTGKAIVKNVLGKTQAEVKEKLKKAIAESGELDIKRSGLYTVGEWMDLWYEVYAKPRIDVKTVSSMLGHSSAGFTLATYTHATSKVLRAGGGKDGQPAEAGAMQVSNRRRRLLASRREGDSKNIPVWVKRILTDD